VKNATITNEDGKRNLIHIKHRRKTLPEEKLTTLHLIKRKKISENNWHLKNSRAFQKRTNNFKNLD